MIKKFFLIHKETYGRIVFGETQRKKMQKGIQIHNLSKSFQKKKVLNGISLNLCPGESLAIMGQSGTGKSVLLKCLLGLMPWDQGQCSIGPWTIGHESDKKQSERFFQSGVVFQSYALFDSLSVWENVAFRMKGSQAEKREKALIFLQKVGLSAETADLYPSEVSGGMKRRISIARAIALSPSYLFFDEPVEGLDPIFAQSISLLIRQVINQLQATSLMITHNLKSAFLIADTIAVLHEGKIIWQGSPEEMKVSSHPFVQAFLDSSDLTQIPSDNTER